MGGWRNRAGRNLSHNQTCLMRQPNPAPPSSAPDVRVAARRVRQRAVLLHERCDLTLRALPCGRLRPVQQLVDQAELELRNRTVKEGRQRGLEEQPGLHVS